MTEINFLLCRGSPRSNIHDVEFFNKLLPCDRLMVRYIPEYQAYKIMRNYFLSHPEYTHMVLATDDIVVIPEHVIQLKKDLQTHDYPVLSGMMNVNQGDKINVNLSMRIAAKERSFRTYYWINRNDLPVQSIFQVEFSGFPLMAIRRDIVERFEFDADKILMGGKAENGASLDLVFCWKCKEVGIPIFADQRIDMRHLRKEGKFQIGILPEKVELMTCDYITEISF